MIHKMQRLAQRSHAPEAETQRQQTRVLHHQEAAAIDLQRDRLRDTSIIPSEQARYGMKRAHSDYAGQETRGSAEASVGPNIISRADALAARLREHHPPRYSVDAWLAYRNKSIEILQPFYPNCTITDMCPF